MYTTKWDFDHDVVNADMRLYAKWIKDDDDGFKIIGKFDDISQFSDVKKVKAITSYGEVDGKKEYVVAEADFKNDGFTINLPATLDAKYLIPIEELIGTSTITISNKSANVSTFVTGIGGFNSVNEQIFVFGNAKEDDNTMSAMSWIYADGDVSISGNFTRPGHWDTNFTYSLNLTKGWNVAYVTEREDDDEEATYYVITSSTVSGLKWFGEEWED